MPAIRVVHVFIPLLLLLLLIADALAIAEGRGTAAALSEAVAQANLGRVSTAHHWLLLAAPGWQAVPH
jgi:hypothetical protein